MFLEWKGGSAPLPNAQRWFHEAITLLSDNVTSYIIRGDVTSGDVYGVQIVRSGQVGDIIKADSNRLAEMCRRWSKKVAPNRQ